MSAAVGLTLAACGVDADVVTSRAEPLSSDGTTPPDTTDATDDTTVDTGSTPSTEPGGPTTTSDQVIDASNNIADVVDVGDGKEPRPYDGFLTAAFSDIEAFWRSSSRRCTASEFAELDGGIYAAYPERTDDIPGCGTPQTTYLDVQGNRLLLRRSATSWSTTTRRTAAAARRELGQSVVAVVLAHEFGHAVQSRADEFDASRRSSRSNRPTASPVRGRRASQRRERRDQLHRRRHQRRADRDDPGPRPGRARRQDRSSAHGTAFDRVGAFQDGFIGGANGARPSSPMAARPADQHPVRRRGDRQRRQPAVRRSEPDDDRTIRSSSPLLQPALDRFWTAQLAASDLTLTLADGHVFSPTDELPTCDGIDSSASSSSNVRLCAASNTIFIDQDVRRAADRRPDLLGDMSVGYLVSQGYSENVQVLLGSTLHRRAACARSTTACRAHGQPTCTPGRSRPGGGEHAVLSAGDLDEAVRHGDRARRPHRDTNINGSAFEKIDASEPACSAACRPAKTASRRDHDARSATFWPRSTSAPTASTSSSPACSTTASRSSAREKETVRLGHGGGDMKELSPDAIDRGISCLRRMQRIAAATVAHRSGGRHQRGPRGRQRRRLPPPRQQGGEGRHRGDLRARGSAADPPRCAAGGAGVRPAAAARRHRRRLDRGAGRRARRDAGGAQLQARRRATDRPLLPRRRDDAEGPSTIAARTSARSSPRSSAEVETSASTSRSPRRARPRRSPG